MSCAVPFWFIPIKYKNKLRHFIVHGAWVHLEAENGIACNASMPAGASVRHPFATR